MDITLQIEFDKLLDMPWEDMTKAQRERYHELCGIWEDSQPRRDYSNAGCLLPAPEATFDGAW